jgi:hypothetical protein
MADYSIEVSIPNVGPQGPQGEVGPVGPANELTLGEITTGDAGTEAEATISGTPPNQVLDLVLPRGDTGAQGNPGPTGAGGVGVVPAPIYATMQEAVEDGITFGGVFRHTSGSVFWVEEPDPDAATFIAASGATDVWNIQKFVQGVKTLGLWDDMVCWPLRSAQNAGAGTTAYSLGGLGAFNGTLVNGPTWGVDGVNFNVSNCNITVTANFSQPLTIVGAANFKTLTNGGSIIDGTGLNDRITLFNGADSAKLSLFAGAVRNSSNNYTAGNNIFGAAYVDGSNSIVYLDGTANTAGNAGTNPLGPTTIRIGNNVSNNFGDKNIDIAFCCIFSGQAYNDAVRALYKETLGLGLSLP